MTSTKITQDATPAPAHKITADAASNRKAARAVKSTAVKATAPKASAAKKATPAVKSTAKKATPAVKSTAKATPVKASAERKPAASKSDDAIARHIAEVFATEKKGAALKVSEIVKRVTKSFPKDDERPPTTTISGRCRVGLLPEGIEGTATPRGARKIK